MSLLIGQTIKKKENDSQHYVVLDKVYDYTDKQTYYIISPLMSRKLIEVSASIICRDYELLNFTRI